MKVRFLSAAKTIALGSLLLFADITIRYLLERIDLFKVRPVTIPHYDDSHIVNIITAFPFLFVFTGWAYIGVVLLFLYYKKKTQLPRLINVLVAFVLLMVFFLLFWLFDRDGSDNGIGLLKEGIFVYMVLAIGLEFAFNPFIRTRYQNDAA
jgi:presenilin-like A22 family membrane protease